MTGIENFYYLKVWWIAMLWKISFQWPIGLSLKSFFHLKIVWNSKLNSFFIWFKQFLVHNRNTNASGIQSFDGLFLKSKYLAKNIFRKSFLINNSVHVLSRKRLFRNEFNSILSEWKSNGYKKLMKINNYFCHQFVCDRAVIWILKRRPLE